MNLLLRLLLLDKITEEFPMFVLLQRYLALAAQNSNIIINDTPLAPNEIITDSQIRWITGHGDGSHYRQFTLKALPNAKVSFITYSNGVASENILIKKIGTKISIKRIGDL